MGAIGSYTGTNANFRSCKKKSLEAKVRKTVRFTLKDTSEVEKRANHQKILHYTSYLPKTMGTQKTQGAVDRQVSRLFLAYGVLVLLQDGKFLEICLI